ncbi:MAG: ABC transporter substrate-binding protein [Anaerolineales bacterium]|jgi:ABC-type oligopeptide transport system substrate-binding subunit/DNA-binding SARP family transcriptional activator
MSDTLEIYTLGRVRLFHGGDRLDSLESRKAQALLIYLVCGRRPYGREVLADLLWDERSQSRALSNLRNLLSNLRKELGEYLTITRGFAGINPEAKIWLDAAVLEKGLHTIQQQGGLISASAAEQVKQLLTLYKGEFLEGFYVSGCRGFEDWLIGERERLHRLVVDALHDLVSYALQIENYKTGIAHATRMLELDPLMEDGQRQLMRLLVSSGQRGAALEQYERCRELLQSELGVEPEALTQALYAEIKAGVSGKPVPSQPISEIRAADLPTFLKEEIPDRKQERPVFVARAPQLSRLQDYLEAALSGEGQVAFVIGGPGRGKTALLKEFARRSMQSHPDLLVVRGGCSAYTGVGDPYLPFRDVLGMLSGDVEAKWSAGEIQTEQARRLWAAVPLTMRALLDHGSDLVRVFFSGKGLLARAASAMPGEQQALQSLSDLLEREQTSPGTLEQNSLCEQYGRLLSEVARQKSLVILLDDLQWADHASLNLLFHLGRRLEGVRIMIAGAYRPEEVATGREGERHPLEKLLAELKVRYGDIWIDLNQVGTHEGQHFVKEFLDSEPNRLSEAFRESLYSYTQGHALFTIEMLRNLEERGDLVKDEHGKWVEGGQLHWEVLPTRIEGVIEERMLRLEPELRQILNAACVEGEVFTLQVLARVCKSDERELAKQLSQHLERQYRLVKEEGHQIIGSQGLFQYRFQHFLFQQHLYKGLSTVERKLLHADIAQALEELHKEIIDQIAGQIAHHWLQASEFQKAIPYLQIAGDQARAVYANQEAVHFYQQALAILKERGEHEQAARTLMKLGLTYHNAFDFPQARRVYQEAFTFWRQAEKVFLHEARPISPAPHALRLQYPYEPETLDITRYPIIEDMFTRALFSGLVQEGPQMEILPDIAYHWEMLDGGRTYIFHLRQDARWSDGEPVQASDFVAAWQRLLDPTHQFLDPSYILYDLRGAKDFHLGHAPASDLGVKALDEATLLVELNDPCGYFLSLMSNCFLFPIPAHKVARFGDAWSQPEHLVTNGAFRLASWKRGEEMRLVRNPDYYGRFGGNVEEVLIHFISPSAGGLEMYTKNQLDILDIKYLNSESLEAVRRHYAEEYHCLPSLQIYRIDFDTSRPPFNDGRVRRAFAQAIDRQTLASVILCDQELPASGGVVPPGMPGHTPGIALPFDPRRAKQLLAEAGYPNGLEFPEIIVVGWTLVFFHSIKQFVKEQWEKILNIKISMHVRPESQLLNFEETQIPHASAYVWTADYPDPANFFQFSEFLSLSHWHDSQFEALIEEARRCMDQERRMRNYDQAQRILVEAAPVFPLFYLRRHILQKPWVRKYPSVGSYSFDWKEVILEPHP